MYTKKFQPSSFEARFGDKDIRDGRRYQRLPLSMIKLAR